MKNSPFNTQIESKKTDTNRIYSLFNESTANACE